MYRMYIFKTTSTSFLSTQSEAGELHHLPKNSTSIAYPLVNIQKTIEDGHL